MYEGAFIIMGFKFKVANRGAWAQRIMEIVNRCDNFSKIKFYFIGSQQGYYLTYKIKRNKKWMISQLSHIIKLSSHTLFLWFSQFMDLQTFEWRGGIIYIIKVLVYGYDILNYLKLFIWVILSRKMRITWHSEN